MTSQAKLRVCRTTVVILCSSLALTFFFLSSNVFGMMASKVHLPNLLSESLGKVGHVCNGSVESSKGNWRPFNSSSSSDSFRAPVYPLYDLWTACGDESRRFLKYERKDDCTVLDSMEAASRLGNRSIYFVGDSLTGELFYSIRWLRRRVIVYNSLWVQPSFGTAVTALSCSQGWEGTYETNNWLLDSLRRYAGWEKSRKAARETCGMVLLQDACTHCGLPTIWRTLASAPPRESDVLVVNLGTWYNMGPVEELEHLLSFLDTLKFPEELSGLKLTSWIRHQLHLANFNTVDKCGGHC